MPKNKINIDKILSKTKVYIVVIAIILIILSIVKPVMIIPSIILFAIILIYTIWANKKRSHEITEHINEITMSVDKAAQSTIMNSPFPLVILDTTGSIIWRSNKFVSEFANIDIDSYLSNIIKEVKLKADNYEKINSEPIYEKINIGSKTYKVIGEYTKIKEKDHKNTNEHMITVYFMDETAKESLKLKYDNSKICVGIIVIDNYEEMMQRASEEEKLKVTSEIEKNIYAWINKYNGIAIKSERDTYICIFEKVDVEKMKNDKFDILDEIKEIKTQEKIQSTLSIAISEEGSKNIEKYKSAKSIIDIALGRGGDQAIIKQEGKYIFFGGRTQEVEKRTKVKARIIAQGLEELITNSENVIIMGHTNSDIDSIGSALGIYRIAKTLNKEAYVVSESSGTSLDTFLEDLKQIDEYEEALINKQEALSKINSNSLLVVVDTQRENYVDCPELLDKTEKIVIIDHHRRGTDYIKNSILTFHEVYASSACELVTELIEYCEGDVNLKTIEVEALYAGIMMDTKNFTFKTGVRTFEAAAYLRKCGVDIIKVKKWFQSDLETYNKISEIVTDSEIVNDNIAISIYNKEDSDTNVICAKAADELLTISNITASFVIGKLGDKVYISGRSIGDINVQLILEKLGGGGHITVAGAQVDGMTKEEVKQELINRINEYFAEIA